MTDNQAMTLEEQAVEAAGIILHAAGSSLRNYTPHAKDEILACTRHAITEAYDRGRRDGLDSQAQDDGLRNRIIELEAENEKLRKAIEDLVDNAKSQAATSLVVLNMSKAMNARISELEAENARLTAQVAVADGCAESLREFVSYQGGADHATDDEYVMERAQYTLTAYDTAKENLND